MIVVTINQSIGFDLNSEYENSSKILWKILRFLII
jgi:hypothetical protein